MIQLAIVFAVLHILVALTIGPLRIGSFCSNALQTLASGIAAWMSFRAAKRGRGLGSSFWQLVGFGWATWGIANGGWMFYEVVLGHEPPALSAIRFLFDIQGAFFAMALFLDEERDSAKLDVATILDFLQIGIIYLLIYVGLYYIPAQSLSHQEGMIRELYIMVVENLSLIVLSAVRAVISSSPETKKLYKRFAIFMAVFCTGAQATMYGQFLYQTTAAVVLGAAWSVLLLGGAYLATSWEPELETQNKAYVSKSTGGMLYRNMMFALGPLFVTFLTSQLGPAWMPLRVTMLGLSILCYATRVALNERRQT